MPGRRHPRAARRLPHPRPANARLVAQRRLRLPGSRPGRDRAVVTDETTEREKLRGQLQAASEAFQGAAGRLLREGEMAPQLIVLAAAQVVGELGRPWRWLRAWASRRRSASWRTSRARPGASSTESYRPRPCPPRGTPEPGSVATTAF